jgi:type IV secretory pathway ATPase VirB11/archaellum biosynthesis ATPase
MRGDTTLRHILRPIASPLAHPEVTDIVINEPHRVGVRQAGTWSWLDVPEFDFDTLDAATILIGQRTGREFDEANPYVNSTMPDGQRFQGVRPPGTKAGRLLWAIRRPPAVARSFDDDDFEGLFENVGRSVVRRQRVAADLGSHLRNREWRTLFRSARLAGMSAAFCGPTGSGKTDMVRRAAQVYRPGIRQVSLETDDELGDVGSENRAPLFYDDTQISRRGSDDRKAARAAGDHHARGTWRRGFRAPDGAEQRPQRLDDMACRGRPRA